MDFNQHFLLYVEISVITNPGWYFPRQQWYLQLQRWIGMSKTQEFHEWDNTYT